MLHTWTLSVEEQFYILAPFFFWAFGFAALSKWKLAAVFGIILGSLALSAFWVGHDPDAAFYLLPSRAWELALGAALALLPSVTLSPILPRLSVEIASLVGLFMIGAAIVVYDSTTPFPGFAALLPCVGTALVIAAGTGRPAVGNRILSFAPFVWIERISYSLYLWHWPIFVFSRLILNRDLSVVERRCLVALTFAVAWLSWKFVETPIRTAKLTRGSRSAWAIGGLAAVVLSCILGATLVLGAGFPQRSSADVSWVAEIGKEEDNFQHSPCLAQGTRDLPKAAACLLGARSPAARYQVVLWGDSHAAQFAPAVDAIGRGLGFTARQISEAACPPVPGINYATLNKNPLACDGVQRGRLERNSRRQAGSHCHHRGAVGGLIFQVA